MSDGMSEYEKALLNLGDEYAHDMIELQRNMDFILTHPKQINDAVRRLRRLKRGDRVEHIY